jgi:aconitate hydratase
MPSSSHPDSFHAAATLTSGAQTVHYFSLSALEASDPSLKLGRLPYSLRILLENLLRCEDDKTVTADDIKFLATWDAKAEPSREIAYMPARVLMQDFTGVPAIVDLAAMRDAMQALGGGPEEVEKINPLVPAELVIDHSVQVDEYGSANAYDLNAALEFTRNRERYAFLKWGQTAFNNFSAVPPGMGICHQVNLEYLARVCFTKTEVDGSVTAYPDTLVGTDSHTTMINGLGGGGGGHRSGGCDAGPAGVHAGAAGGGVQAGGQIEGGYDRHGSGVDRDGDAAQAGRGGQVCGVLWAGNQRTAAGGSRYDCEYGAGVRGDVRDLSGG